MRKLRLFLFLSIFILLSFLPLIPKKTEAAFAYRDAAVVGKVLSYDSTSNAFVIYGRLSVNDGRKWRVVETRKFYRIFPTNKEIAGQLKARIGVGAKAFGVFQSIAGSREDHLLVRKVTLYDPKVDPPAGLQPAYGPGIGPDPWIGFGVAVLSQQFTTFSIDKVGDFVEHLAGLRDAVMGCDGERSREEMKLSTDVKTFANHLFSPSKPEDRALRKRFTDAWRSCYNTKWYTEKEVGVLAECRRATGGSAFFVGQKGGANGLVESVPVTRPDISRFMSSPRGGGDEIESGPAVFFASVSAVRDKYGRIIALYASGPFFTTPSALVSGIKSGSAEHSGTWRIEGWDRNRAEVLDGKRCWLSGIRVLVYDDKGNLIDHYFALNKSLTASEFNTLLDIQREIAMRGGI